MLRVPIAGTFRYRLHFALPLDLRVLKGFPNVICGPCTFFNLRDLRKTLGPRLSLFFAHVFPFFAPAFFAPAFFTRHPR